MRKLTAAGMLAAGALGLSLQAQAQVTYDITGSFNATDNACTQIVFGIGGGDCSYANGRRVDASPPPWFGPTDGASYYAVGSAGDTPQEAPPGTPVFAAPITGTITVNDNGTPSGTDDTIAGSIVVGAAVRNLVTGQATRGMESWDTMTFTVPATTVTFATANGQGGFDYVIGSQGFPIAICNVDTPANCFPTPSFTGISPPVNPDDTFAVPWSGPDPAGVGIEASTLLNPPSGNIGIALGEDSVTFTNYQCETIVALTGAPATNECNNNVAISQVLLDAPVANNLAEPAGRWGNLVMKISTSNDGQITSAEVYWTHEYYIRFPANGAPTGTANSWGAGKLTFTGETPVPKCNDDTVEVLENSSNNIIDVLVESCTLFPPSTTTVTILTPPTKGTATVNGSNQIVYTPNAGPQGSDSLVYEADGGGFTDPATLTINVVPDTQPVTPDGQITINTQGVAPASTPGNLNVSTLPGFNPGNSGVVTVSVPAKGTATVSGTTVTYTPGATFFSGTDSFNYTVTDQQNDTSTGTITVSIANVNPTISGGSISTDQDEASLAVPVTFTLGNGSPAQHPLTIGTQATGGTCTLSSATATSGATVTYTPSPGFFGPDSCVVRIADGDGSVADGTFTISVEEVSNDIRLPGGGGSVDAFTLAMLAGLPLLLRRRRVR